MFINHWKCSNNLYIFFITYEVNTYPYLKEILISTTFMLPIDTVFANKN